MKPADGLADIEHSSTGLPKTGWMKMMCKRIGNKDDIEVILLFETIPKFHVFHCSFRE
jgi:hypothetical protein